MRSILSALVFVFALATPALANDKICEQPVSAADISAVDTALPGPSKAMIFERYWPSRRQGGGTCSGFVAKENGGNIAFRYYQRKLVDGVFQMRADPVQVMSLSSFSVGNTDCEGVMKLAYQPGLIRASCTVGGNSHQLDILQR